MVSTCKISEQMYTCVGFWGHVNLWTFIWGWIRIKVWGRLNRQLKHNVLTMLLECFFNVMTLPQYGSNMEITFGVSWAVLVSVLPSYNLSGYNLPLLDHQCALLSVCDYIVPFSLLMILRLINVWNLVKEQSQLCSAVMIKAYNSSFTKSFHYARTQK